jgi:hypothetical protein
MVHVAGVLDGRGDVNDATITRWVDEGRGRVRPEFGPGSLVVKEVEGAGIGEAGGGVILAVVGHGSQHFRGVDGGIGGWGFG